MPENTNEKPCLVDTGRGFSVSYKKRFLYSKYAPEKTILNLISSLKILPGTLFVISSPCLWHGIFELLTKLPENSFVLAIEADRNLYEFSKNWLDEKILKSEEILKRESNGSDYQQIENYRQKILFLPPEKLSNIVNIVLGEKCHCENDCQLISTSQNANKANCNFPPIYNFRRAVYLEFSGGADFFKEFYQKIAFQVQNAIGSFWKNRLTLTKLGRLYSRNLFKNLTRIPESIEFSNFKNKIEKPIFIFGAGESTVETLKKIKKEEIEKCFVLCVDAALPVLSAFKISPDAIVAVEAQLAIEKSYIGNSNLDSVIFADLSSRPSVLNHTKKGICFFASDFANAKFLDNLKKKAFFPESIPALGSVGLTASCLAVLLRKDENVPIFASGLDFDFSLGKTHAQNAPAHLSRLIKTNRFVKIENYDAAFKIGAQKIGNFNGLTFFTDISLSSYAESFKDAFCGTKNFFNCSDFGLNLGLPFVNASQTKEFLNKIPPQELLRSARNCKPAQLLSTENQRISRKSEIIKYLKNEENALEKIKFFLTNGKEKNETQQDFDKRLEDFVSCREYLFLHFPDGYKCDTKNLSFLKRVRGEIDFFLKDIKNAESVLKTSEARNVATAKQ